jgi:hypothetical protein
MYTFANVAICFFVECLVFVTKAIHNVTPSKLVLNLFQYVTERAELCLEIQNSMKKSEYQISNIETNPNDQNSKCETVMIWRTVHLHLLKG